MRAFGVLASYLLGSVPTGYLLFRARSKDIRDFGSRSTGATNVLRLKGWRSALPVALIDMLKGFLPVFLAVRIFADPALAALCGSPPLSDTAFRSISASGAARAWPRARGLCRHRPVPRLAVWPSSSRRRPHAYVSLGSILAASPSRRFPRHRGPRTSSSPWRSRPDLPPACGEHRVCLSEGTERKFGERVAMKAASSAAEAGARPSPSISAGSASDATLDPGGRIRGLRDPREFRLPARLQVPRQSISHDCLRGRSRRARLHRRPLQFCRTSTALAPARPGQAVISLTKGLEKKTLMRMSQVMAEVFRPSVRPPLGVLSGPSFSKEVARDSHGPGPGLREPAGAREVQPAVSSVSIRAYTSRDVVGVEIAGALKNVVAIAAGITDALSFGHNARAALITRGLAEITPWVSPWRPAGDLFGPGRHRRPCPDLHRGAQPQPSVGLELGGAGLEAYVAQQPRDPRAWEARRPHPAPGAEPGGGVRVFRQGGRSHAGQPARAVPARPRAAGAGPRGRGPAALRALARHGPGVHGAPRAAGGDEPRRQEAGGRDREDRAAGAARAPLGRDPVPPRPRLPGGGRDPARGAGVPQGGRAQPGPQRRLRRPGPDLRDVEGLRPRDQRAGQGARRQPRAAVRAHAVVDRPAHGRRPGQGAGRATRRWSRRTPASPPPRTTSRG